MEVGVPNTLCVELKTLVEVVGVPKTLPDFAKMLDEVEAGVPKILEVVVLKTLAVVEAGVPNTLAIVEAGVPNILAVVEVGVPNTLAVVEVGVPKTLAFEEPKILPDEVVAVAKILRLGAAAPKALLDVAEPKMDDGLAAEEAGVPKIL